MTSQPEEELIHIIYSYDDVLAMAEGAGIDFDIACQRAEQWAKYIEETAMELISDQLYNCIQYDNP